MAYHILVVDDEKLIVKGIRFSLEQDNSSLRWGRSAAIYQRRKFRSGGAGCHAAQNGRFAGLPAGA